MAETDLKAIIPSTKTTSPDNAGPIIEESQESEEYQQDLQVVLGTAFGVIAVVGLIALGLLLYRLYRIRSGNLSHNQNDDLNLFERDISLDVADKSDGYSCQPTVLMLYAQDCPIHERMVASLANFLMEACGCVVSLDLLEEAELVHRGLDDWLIERLQEADFILTVCSLGARLRCSKKHLRFKKWTSLISGQLGRTGTGNNSLSSSPTLKKLSSGRKKEPGKKGEGKHTQEGPSQDTHSKDNILTSLSGEIADYFAVAVDYVAEKMRVEQQKGLGLGKFINVYFDYSARSDIPPQLEMAEQYCLLRDLKQLRQHLMGSSRPNTSMFQSHTNEREEGITIERFGDGSEKSEEGEGSSSSSPCQPCDILETETGMLLRATLEQAKTFFTDNPSWMEEQMERASPVQSAFGQTSYLKKGRDKKWLKKRRHFYPGPIGSKERLDSSCSWVGSVKEPLLDRYSQRQADDKLTSALSSKLSPRSNHGRSRKNTDWSRDEINVDTDIQRLEQTRDRMRNTLPRSSKTVSNIVDADSNALEGWVSNELDGESPIPQGVLLSRQNSLPSSLAGVRTPELADVSPSAAPSPSHLRPATKLSCLSKSADSFAMSRDLKEWHPMDQERQPCLYCNSTQLDKGCTRCRPTHLGNPKGLPDCDIEPGFSSSAEGVPALVAPRAFKHNSKSQTVLQAEVHQEWRPGKGKATQSSFNIDPKECISSVVSLSKGDNVPTQHTNAVVEVENNTSHSVQQQMPNIQNKRLTHSGQGLKAVDIPRQTAKRDNPGMRRWVSGIVQSPNHLVSTDDNRNYSNSLKHHPPSLPYHPHGTQSPTSSLSSHDDSVSIASTDSASEGDSLERDLRSIEKISSFHDFVVSSSFVDRQGTTSVCQPESFSSSSLLPPVTMLPQVSRSLYQPEHV